jgi:glycosyltransferase involved in cell wall biosynthesis
MTNALRLVYIIGTFPAFSTTFIDREIKSLRRQGVTLQIVAIRRPTSDQPLSKDQLALQKSVIYLLPANLVEFLVANLLFILFRPGVYLQTLFYLLSRPHPNLKRWAMTLLHFAEGVYAAHLLRHRHFDQLHAHFIDRAAVVALVVSRLLEVPYSLTAHANDIYAGPVLLQEKLQNAKFVTTCTGYNYNYLKQSLGHILNGKLHLAYHGLDLANYYPPETPAQRTPPLIFSVGRLTEKKGYIYLIKACRLLKDRGYQFDCQIVGSGPLQEELQAQIETHGLADTMTLCGALPHEAVVDRYREATLFVLPCIVAQDGDRDGIPNVLIEAMAMGLPVVSTDHSGIPELIEHNATGLLVPPNQVEPLAKALTRLLDQPDLRAELATQGRKKVRDQFEVEQNVRCLHDLFVAKD